MSAVHEREVRAKRVKSHVKLLHSLKVCMAWFDFDSQFYTIMSYSDLNLILKRKHIFIIYLPETIKFKYCQEHVCRHCKFFDQFKYRFN